MADKFTTEVPQDVIWPDPEDESPDRMLTVEFEWSPGYPATGMSGPPENYDPGSPDEFFILGMDLSDDQEERLIEWLDEHWERPQDGSAEDWLADMREEDRIRDEAEGLFE